MASAVITLSLTTTLTAIVSSQCTDDNGCGSSATCDVEFVSSQIYGCGGIWVDSGVSNGEYLCADGYSICDDYVYAESLGLTRGLCLSSSLLRPNYFYTSLQSGPGSLQCSESGTDDLFGCASTDSTMVYIDDAINCGPFGAQLSSFSGDAWKYGWEVYSDATDEIGTTRHLHTQQPDASNPSDWHYTNDTVGGVLCCIDNPNRTNSSSSSAKFTPVQQERIAKWKSRSIYQLLTDRFAKSSADEDSSECSDLSAYCGGTWRGIIDHLDYIEGMGFDAIWISPVVENTANGYHGYWAKNLYAVNTQFGSEADLLALVEELHARDMLLMIDVVINHMGYDNYSAFTPFNESVYFHDSCNLDLCANNVTEPCWIHSWDFYTDEGREEIELCQLAGLPDLNQSNEFVSETLCGWLDEYVLGRWLADAIRVDTVPEVDAAYWSYLLSNSCVSDQHSLSAFSVGEHFNGDSSVVGDWQSRELFDSLFGYPMYYTIRNVFGSSMAVMTRIDDMVQEYKANFVDYTALSIFTDNHDNSRWLCEFAESDGDLTNYKNALLFMLTFPGIPMVYYGTEQAFDGCHDPLNREALWTSGYNTSSELYQYIAVINRYRKEYAIYDGGFKVMASEAHVYAFRRGGNVFVVLSNDGKSHTVQIEGVDAGKYCNVFDVSDDCVEYAQDVVASVQITGGEPKMYVLVSEDTDTDDEESSAIPSVCASLLLYMVGIVTLFFVVAW